MRAGSAALCNFLSAIEEPIPHCPDCGQEMRCIDHRTKYIVSMMGNGELNRGYYVCDHCGAHFIPRDTELDMVGTSHTPGVRRSVSLLACSEPFEWSSNTLEEISGISVSPKECQRIAEETGENIEKIFVSIKDEVLVPVKHGCDGVPNKPVVKDIPVGYLAGDGTGVPMVPSELDGRSGKQEDGSSKTREAKLGCIFTQTSVDKDGNPVRDPNTTRYFGAIETSEEFGKRLYANAEQYGLLARAKVVVILGDGARWIWLQGKLHFPNAILIVDLYHAKEHVHNLVKKLRQGAAAQKELLDEWLSLLENGQALELSNRIMNYPAENKEQADCLKREAGFFFDNADKMKYDEFKEKGFFVGSGVIEAGCKTIVGKRLKQSGMFWSEYGANAIIALRCNELSSPQHRLSA